ncbi:AAA family ATPase [Virgibacillus pantothenticus]|uniref:AAA family ATPase n=1 Tax=Virgibacillus pantothenticus TaxID=1473 RepID=UPI002014E10D|nr:AAA family ATPase [Virgibacillus pantothenticus]
MGASYGGVLFIDEAYQLVGKFDNDFGKQAIETLLTYLEDHRDKFILILAGYTEEMNEFLKVNPGLRSRIPNEIVFPDYSPDEVATIVEKNITKEWKVNTQLLRYTNLPSNEKANARWAGNFLEKLIQNHKVWVVENNSTTDHLMKINNESFLNCTRGI